MHKFSKFISIGIMAVLIISYKMGIRAYATETYNRIGGADRYLTAVEISNTGWPEGSENVVLATADDFPDALCAAPLAKELDAPILLVGKDELDKVVKDEIERLGASKAIIVGGDGVISSSVEGQLSDMGLDCVRLGGEDRYETSLDIADYMAQKLEIGDELAIATGDDFPDALSIASIAGIKGMPILLSQKDELLEGIEGFIDEHDITDTYIVGGTGVISSSVEEKLPNSVRLGGEERYETNVKVLSWFKDDIDLNRIYLATGNDYPDALSGSVLAAKYSAPIVLVDKIPPKPALDFVADNRLSIRNITAIGGEGVVPGSCIEPFLPKIESIENIVNFIDENKKCELPSSVKAYMDNGTFKDVAVDWTKSSNTNEAIVREYTGSVKGYSSDVTLDFVIKHKIMGKSVLSAKQLTNFVKEYNPDFNPEIAEAFIDIGNKYGIRGDIAFCQSIHETGYFKFGGDVKPEQNNFAGIGATGGGNPGNSFSTIEEGVTAQMQHLYAYASTKALPDGEELVDPRFTLIKVRGTAPYWEDLGAKWACPGYDTSVYNSFEEAMISGATYGQNIISIYQRIIDNVQ